MDSAIDAPGDANDEATFPCPSLLWRGVFAEVAEVVGKRTWEVWLGTAVALGARAHRNIHVRYHANLYGWLYGLLVAPTGTGKSVCTDLCEALLPEDYRWESGVQSGPGLVSILADVERDTQGKVASVSAFPAALILPEWTTLARNLKITNATLEQDLNMIFDGKAKWTTSRSEASKHGGGRVTIPTPSLSICGTTTDASFHDEVSVRLLRSGFINRYLVLPGTHTRWKLFDESAGIDYDRLRDLPLPLAHTFGNGVRVWSLYTPEAIAHWQCWGVPLFQEQLMAPSANGTADIYKRLHTYTHKIAMLYAWSEHSPVITLDHLLPACAVIETSRAFLSQLYDDLAPDVPAFIHARAVLDDEILRLVAAAPGLRKDTLCQRLRRHGGYSTIATAVENLLKAGALRMIPAGEKKTLKTLFVA